jgi:hypothetical protein
MSVAHLAMEHVSDPVTEQTRLWEMMLYIGVGPTHKTPEGEIKNNLGPIRVQ